MKTIIKFTSYRIEANVVSIFDNPIFFSDSCKSYDGTGPGYGPALSEQQQQQHAHTNQPTAAGSRHSRQPHSASNTASSSSSSGSSSGSTGGCPSSTSTTASSAHHRYAGTDVVTGAPHWRTSSCGSAAADHPRVLSKSPAHIGVGGGAGGGLKGVAGGGAAHLQVHHHHQIGGKMADLNITRGHSPNFSPSRNNGECEILH